MSQTSSTSSIKFTHPSPRISHPSSPKMAQIQSGSRTVDDDVPLPLSLSGVHQSTESKLPVASAPLRSADSVGGGDTEETSRARMETILSGSGSANEPATDLDPRLTIYSRSNVQTTRAAEENYASWLERVTINENEVIDVTTVTSLANVRDIQLNFVHKLKAKIRQLGFLSTSKIVVMRNEAQVGSFGCIDGMHRVKALIELAQEMGPSFSYRNVRMRRINCHITPWDVLRIADQENQSTQDILAGVLFAELQLCKRQLEVLSGRSLISDPNSWRNFKIEDYRRLLEQSAQPTGDEVEPQLEVQTKRGGARKKGVSRLGSREAGTSSTADRIRFYCTMNLTPGAWNLLQEEYQQMDASLQATSNQVFTKNWMYHVGKVCSKKRPESVQVALMSRYKSALLAGVKGVKTSEWAQDQLKTILAIDECVNVAASLHPRDSWSLFLQKSVDAVYNKISPMDDPKYVESCVFKVVKKSSDIQVRLKDPKSLPNPLIRIFERNWDARLYGGRTFQSLLLNEDSEPEPELETGGHISSDGSESQIDVGVPVGSDTDGSQTDAQFRKKRRTDPSGSSEAQGSRTRRSERLVRQSASRARVLTAEVAAMEMNMDEALTVNVTDLLADDQFNEYFLTRCNVSNQNCIQGLAELQNYITARSVDFFLVDAPWECMDPVKYPRDHTINNDMMRQISLSMAFLLANSGNAIVYYGMKNDQGPRWKAALSEAGLHVEDFPLLISFAPEACGRGSSGHKFRNVFHCAWLVSRRKQDRGTEKPVRNLQGMPTYVPSEYSSDTNHISGYKPPSARERLKDAEGPLRKEERPVNLMKEFLHRFTNPRATVVDVFGGTFSMGLAALYTGRNYVAFEIDKRCFDAAEKRLRNTCKLLINAGTLRPHFIQETQFAFEVSLSDWKVLESQCSIHGGDDSGGKGSFILNVPPYIRDTAMMEIMNTTSDTAQGQLPTYGALWDYMQSDEGIEKLLTLEQNLQHVNVRESNLPGTGKGLFTTKDFRKNEIVGYYWGRILSTNQARELYPHDGSLSDAGRLLNLEGIAMASQRQADITIDASRSCIASYCQHQPMEAANTIFREVLDSPHRMEWLRSVKNSPNDAITDYRLIELVTCKTIKSGQECFVDYGEGYFKEGEDVVLLSDHSDSE